MYNQFRGTNSDWLRLDFGPLGLANQKRAQYSVLSCYRKRSDDGGHEPQTGQITNIRKLRHKKTKKSSFAKKETLQDLRNSFKFIEYITKRFVIKFL